MIYWGFLKLKDWTIFPWVMTDENGFEFTWLFIIAGYMRAGEIDGGS